MKLHMISFTYLLNSKIQNKLLDVKNFTIDTQF